MSTILELYNKIYNSLEEINIQITDAERSISEITASGRTDILARIKHLEETLEKVDEYVLKVKGFQELAKKNLDSQNVLTIQAPPGYRVNLNRLKNWAMLIDPQSDNDPYAQRVFAVAKCDECFLEQKREEFRTRIEELRNDQTTGLTEEMSRLECEIRELKKQRCELAESDIMNELTEQLSAKYNNDFYSKAPEVYKASESLPSCYLLGKIAKPFFFDDEALSLISERMKDFYLKDKKEILLPFEVSFEHECFIHIACSHARRRYLDKALQNIILKHIDESPAGSRKVFFLDAERFNASALSSLKQLEGTFAMESIPRNQEQLTSVLEEMVSDFGDLDEVIEAYDSVREYNESGKTEKAIPYSTVILLGWPNSFSSRDRELIIRILSNYERYGISLITVTYCMNQNEVEERRRTIPEYAFFNAYKIDMVKKDATISFPEKDTEETFYWDCFEDEIPVSYVESLKANIIEDTIAVNDYTKLYDMVNIPKYSRKIKPIVLPFGIDGKGRKMEISFDKNNFAAYLIGQSGSGKSTLIHTVIAGILRQYHPDNVELWLADFKQVEFKQYIDHTPPHVKYILLDESNELVYDLIEKLNDEMLRRQILLAKLGKEKIEEVDAANELGEPLPVIFVILDEFSIMSQAIDEDQSYKLKLQNLLAKGRALGFKFLFASQKFTSGVTGLTSTARDQIQQRIAMKQSKDEINEVLELSSSLRSEKVNNWIESIPPYYALVKHRIDEDTLGVNRAKVMYFSDNYASRNKFIDELRQKMICEDRYDHSNEYAYMDKQPVFVDGNSYCCYTKGDFSEDLDKVQHEADEIVLSLGVPRLMTRMKPILLSEESRENILLIARNSEQACAASIIFSIIEQAKIQEIQVSVWAYGRNRLYQEYKEVFAKENIEFLEGIDAICGAISDEVEQLKHKKSEKKMIIMLGMDRICTEFEYFDSKKRPVVDGSLAVSDMAAADNELSVLDQMRRELQQRLSPVKKVIRENGKKEGKSKEEINAEINEKRMELKELIETEFKDRQESSEENTDIQKAETKDDKYENAYKATDDFKKLIRQASRCGVNLVVALNSIADLKQMSIRNDEFRHRLAFQLSVDDSRTLFGNKTASNLPEHICMYDDTMERYSFRPYIHKDISWDGWYISEDEKLVNPFGEITD